MELLGLVQTVIEISKSREEYSDDVKNLRVQLDTLCQMIKELDNVNIPNQLYTQLKTAFEDANQTLQKLPEKAGLFDCVKSKLPFMNSFKDIKEKSLQLASLQQLLQLYLVGQIAKSNHQQQKKVEQTQFECTAVDEHMIGDTSVIISLKLTTDEQIKNAFRSHQLNTQEVIPIKFGANINEVCVHKFSREDYKKLSKDVQQIENISREHAVILCQRIQIKEEEKKEVEKDVEKDTKKEEVQSKEELKQQKEQKEQKEHENQQKQFTVPHPKTQAKHDEPDTEVFYSCVPYSGPNETNETNQQQEFEYKFYLQNKGQMGVFLYRDENTKFANEGINLGTWNRFQGDKKIQIFNGDRIGILMKKPDYKQVLIAYEFVFKQ